MSHETVLAEDRLLSDNWRNALIYVGIGSAAGIAVAVVYDKTVYHDLRADYDIRVGRAEDLGATASALALASDYLESEGLIDGEAAAVMASERTELIAEVRQIEKDTPNIVLEQWTWAGVGIIPGIALALGAWATHTKWKRQRQQSTGQDLR